MINLLRDPLVLILTLMAVVMTAEVAVVQWL